MKQSGKGVFANRLFSRKFLGLGAGFLLGVAAGLPVTSAAVAAATQPEEREAERTGDLLQFTSGGHVLGFGEKGVYVARGDHLLRVEFAGSGGAKPVAEGGAEGEAAGPAAPLTAVRYGNLWPGIDLRWEAEEGAVAESVWKIAPDADPGHIRLRYNAPVGIRPDGGLEVRFETGAMKESAPVAWQKIEGRREPVAVRFRLDGSRGGASVVGFEVGSYDPARPLWIDPVLKWNTFLGSESDDRAFAIAVHDSRGVYVAGESETTWGSPTRTHSGGSDAFVAKLTPDGNLVWNTFLGSAKSDGGLAIALDDAGNVYVAGYSSKTWGWPRRAWSGGEDAFAAKLKPDGKLAWNTFLGSTDVDIGWGIAVDGAGSVYVAGYSSKTWGWPRRAWSGGEDAFAAKLGPNGALAWNTFLGSSSNDRGLAIAVDVAGSVYLAGYSYATWGSPKRSHSGFLDAFVAKLKSNGKLSWNTFLGSDQGGGYGCAIALDFSGNIYTTGYSWNTWGSPRRSHSGGWDAFVAKLKPDGSLTWNTFLGSASTDHGFGIAVDGADNVYVVGRSAAGWGSPERPHNGGYDAFAAKLRPNGKLAWNTFLGSPSQDYGLAVAVDKLGGVYAAGYSAATWGWPRRAWSGGKDAFVAKLGEGCSFFVIPTANGKAAVICL